MGEYRLAPRLDEDLRASATWILQDHPQAARRFLDSAFEAFELLARFPEAGPLARLEHKRLSAVRFWVLSPPFNHWLVFYRVAKGGVEVLRVIYGTMNWRAAQEDFFS